MSWVRQSCQQFCRNIHAYMARALTASIMLETISFTRMIAWACTASRSKMTVILLPSCPCPLYAATRQFSIADERTANMSKLDSKRMAGSQSFQQQLITVVAAINLRARVHKHQTRATQLWGSNISDLLKACTQESYGSNVTSWLYFVETYILNVDWWGYSENFFICEDSTASVETNATIFFAQIRCDAGSSARCFWKSVTMTTQAGS